MKVEALDSFGGSWPGQVALHFRRGHRYDVPAEIPAEIAAIWIERGLVEEVRETPKRARQTDTGDGGDVNG